MNLGPKPGVSTISDISQKVRFRFKLSIVTLDIDTPIQKILMR